MSIIVYLFYTIDDNIEATNLLKHSKNKKKNQAEYCPLIIYALYIKLR